MDLITHAIAGLAVGSLSGDPVSITNPIYLSSMVGAIAPDIDVIWGYTKFKKKRDLPCWIQHRSITHSLVGIPILSIIIALTLSFLMSASFGQLLIFSLVGTLSHSLLDLMNCYGVRILWPVNNKSYALGLMPLTDPELIVIFLMLVTAANKFNQLSILTTVILPGYFTLRWALLFHLKTTASLHYQVSPAMVHLMPLPTFVKWAFIVRGK